MASTLSAAQAQNDSQSTVTARAFPFDGAASRHVFIATPSERVDRSELDLSLQAGIPLLGRALPYTLANFKS
jgi:hypothetical protein